MYIHLLEANKAQQDGYTERMELGGGARGPATSWIGGGVCDSEVDEKRGESLHVCGTV